MTKTNKNVQTKITRESIFGALMILMEKKRLQEITITEITQKAGVSRMAFYRNYNVVEDIITTYLDELFDDYAKGVSVFERKDGLESIAIYFTYFRKHEKLIKNLIGSNLTNLIFERGVAFLRSVSENMLCNKPNITQKEAYQIEFYAGGFYKVMIEWVRRGMKESDDDMAKMLYELF